MGATALAEAIAAGRTSASSVMEAVLDTQEAQARRGTLVRLLPRAELLAQADRPASFFGVPMLGKDIERCDCQRAVHSLAPGAGSCTSQGIPA